MANPIIKDVVDYLEDQTRGTVGTDIFASVKPESAPDECIIVYETGGVEPDPDIPLADPTFQVYVRNSDYASGKAVVDNIVDDLHQWRGGTLVTGGNHFYFILLMGEPGHIGRDDQGRQEWTANFRTRIRR